MDAYLARAVDETGLAVPATLLSDEAGSDDRVWAAARDACRHADVLIDLAGTLGGTPLLDVGGRRVYVDLDPGFTQWWHLQESPVGLDGHTHFATVGTRLGTASCDVPDLGRSWIHTLPPVDLSRWMVAADAVAPRLTTVANWRSYGSVDFGGHFYGQKAHSIRCLIELPRRAGIGVTMALAIHPDEVADLHRLHEGGWELVDPVAAAGTPALYRHWIRNSWAELGIAKHGYVTSRSGWFSDRSACYLASGRPVLVSDTGWRWPGPEHDGVISFRDVDEAAAGVRELRLHYARHASGARAFAERHLDAGHVVGALLEKVMS
jgi:hypothetical protein